MISVSEITSTTENSSLVFAGEGHAVYVGSANSTVAHAIYVATLFSNVSILGPNSFGASCHIASNGFVTASTINAVIDRSSQCYAGRGYVTFFQSHNLTDGRDVKLVVRFSSFVFGGAVGKVIHFLASNGSLSFTNVSAVLIKCNLTFGSEGYVIYAHSLTSVVVRNVHLTIQSSDVVVAGPVGAAIYAAAQGGSTFHTTGLVWFCNSTNGQVVSSRVRVAVDQASLQFLGPVGALYYILATPGSSTVDDAGVTIDQSNIRFSGVGYVLFDTSFGVTNVSHVNVTATASNVTLSGRGSSLVHIESVVRAFAVDGARVSVLGGSVVVASQGSVGFLAQVGGGMGTTTAAVLIIVVVLDSAVTVSRVMESKVPFELSTVLLQLNTSLIVLATGGSLTAGLSTVSVVMSCSMLCLAVSNDFTPLAVSQRVPFANVSLESQCSLIGWYNKNLSAAEVMYAAAPKFLGGLFDSMPLLRFRALRMLDVAGAGRVSVSSKRCAWGPVSHELRATGTFSVSSFASASVTPLLSSTRYRSSSGSYQAVTLTRDTTPSRTIAHSTITSRLSFSPPTVGHTQQTASGSKLIQSLSKTLRLHGAADRPKRLTAGSPLVLVATSASLLSSLALGVAGIQTVAARGALHRQCDAQQDGGDTMAPLSDPTSNPFDLTITSLGVVLMFAGGSVASYFLLGLINVAVVVVAVPLLRAPRRWLRRARRERLLVALCLPGSLYSPLMLMLQPLTTASAVLLVSSSRGTASIALGLCLTVALAAVIVALLAELRRGHELGLAAWRPTWRSGLRSRVWFRTLWLADSCDCVAANPDDPTSRQHVERYGAVPSSYASGREWFVAAEVAVAASSGALSGVAVVLDPSVACSEAAVDGFNWALTALYCALLVAVAVSRP